MEWLLPQIGAFDYNHWEPVLLHHPSALAATVLVCICLLALYLFARNLRREKSKRWRIMLFGLRTLALAGLLLLWLQPAVQLQKVINFKTHLLCLIDSSRSMMLPVEPGGISRIEQTAAFFKENSEWLAAASERHRLHFYRFDEKPAAVSLEALKKTDFADGERSDIVASLQDALSNYQPGEVAGVLLFSDGVQVTDSAVSQEESEALFKRMAEQKLPIFAFGAGSQKALPDVAVREVLYDGFAFVHNRISVEARFSSRGLEAHSATARLTAGGAVIQAQELNLPENGEVSVAFSFTPDRVGRFIYTIDILAPPGDAVPDNNSRSFSINVMRDKIRALHVAGRPDYDEQFFRQLLKVNPSVDLISFFILRTPDDLANVAENEMSLIQFPTDELFDKELQSFDLLIFQNFTYVRYQMEQYLENIRRFVENGGGFLMIGGEQSYQPGRYIGTPVASALPVDMLASGEAWSTEPFRPTVTEAGLRHPIMQFTRSPEANRSIWESLPELDGLNLGLVVRPDAVVLAEHPSIKTGGKPAPVISAWRYGKGRALAVAMDSTWRWNFTAAGEGADTNHYRSFWNNAVRWLISDPELKHLKLSASRETARPGEKLQIAVESTDQNFQPLVGVTIKLKGALNAGQPLFSEELTSGDDGRSSLQVMAPAAEGLFVIEAESGSGENYEKTELPIFVQSGGRELEEVGVDFDYLKRAAKLSGGEFNALPHNMDSELELNTGKSRRIGQKKDIPLWDNWLALGLLALTVSVEWWWRRRRRLD